MITIPESLWNSMLDELARETRRVEQVCYLDGVVLGDDGAVTTVTIPNALLEAGRFRVEPGAMSEAGKHFRKLGLRRLAQVHTHPTDWLDHSRWDDEWAYSQLPGAISIVLPHFGRTRPILGQTGVHLRMDGGWRRLSPDQVPTYVRLVPGLIDFRRNHEPAHIEPTRERPWWSVLAFWRR